LPKFFGLHRVKPHRGRQVRFVVMGNVFATNKKIHERFDLKGSTFGRVVTDEERLTFKENVTYKDIDWRAGGKVLRLGPLKEPFCEQLSKDCKLLETLNIMDYSLLVGVHYCERNDGTDCSVACVVAASKHNNHKREKKEKREKKSNGKSSRKEKKSKQIEEKPEMKHGASDSSSEVKKEVPDTQGKKEESDSSKKTESDADKAHSRTKSVSKQQTNFPLSPKFSKQVVSVFQPDDGGMRGVSESGKLHEYYFVGIIDILMLYTLRKRAEHTYKTIRFNSEKSEISSVNPSDYAKRFLEFIMENTT